jgi:hypothetical protein
LLADTVMSTHRSEDPPAVPMPASRASWTGAAWVPAAWGRPACSATTTIAAIAAAAITSASVVRGLATAAAASRSGRERLPARGLTVIVTSTSEGPSGGT